MRIPFIILVTLLVMAPLIYVLFFTPLVDNLLLKLRVGQRARPISKTAAELEQVVVRASARVRGEWDEAIAELDKMTARRFAEDEAEQAVNPRRIAPGKTSGSEKPFKPWAVRNTADPDLFWSASGWVTKDKAHRFDAAEKAEVTLPACGKWYRFRTPTTK